MRTVLFVCAENSFRSIVAEAYFNKYATGEWRAVSAGSSPAQAVHPTAVELMREEGIELGNRKPRPLTRELLEEADMVVVVCGEACPLIHVPAERWELPNPANLELEEARKVVKEIKRRVLELVGRLGTLEGRRRLNPVL
ncbi:MAG: arsenate reductase ArsC [Candidatus Hadarchaeales archaeon]